MMTDRIITMVTVGSNIPNVRADHMEELGQ